jgi:nucleoside-diphosphate-sugar epimerase
MRIALTGSTSGIGIRLNEKLNECGHSTVVLGGRKSKLWQLGEGIPQDLEVDILIHLAHDRKLSLDENIVAARILCDSFDGKKIFLSSFSAHSKSRSKYGRAKYQIEEIFAQTNGCSLRAGVVYGSNIGGIYAQLETLLRICRITPIPYRGLPLLFTTHVDDLTSEIISILSQDKFGTVFAAHPVPISLNELLRQITISLGLKRQFLPLPKQPVDAILRMFTGIAPNFPLTDSLLSLSTTASYEELSRLKIPQSKFRAFKLQS